MILEESLEKVSVALMRLLTDVAGSQGAAGAAVGLSFNEDFSTTDFRNEARTSANGSPSKARVILAWETSQGSAFSFPSTDAAIGSETDYIRSVALGDGDGDLVLIAGNCDGTNKL